MDVDPYDSLDDGPVPDENTERWYQAENTFMNLLRIVWALKAEQTDDRLILEIGDLDLPAHDLAYLRAVTAKIRGACDTISRAVAVEWVDRFGQSRLIMANGQVAEATRETRGAWRVDPTMSAQFCDWLRDQDDETIMATVSGVRVSRMGEAARDTFCMRDSKSVPNLVVKDWQSLPAYVQRVLADAVEGTVIPVGPRKEGGDDE